MKFLQYIARNISYTFAIALVTVTIGWLVGIYGFFLGSSFIIMSYDKLSGNIIKWLPLSIAIPSMIHYIHFGLLTPLGIPAFFKPLRVINRTYRDNMQAEPEDMEKIYANFSDLPMINMLTTVFYTAMVGLIVVAFAIYEFYFMKSYSIIEFMSLMKTVSLAVIIGMIMYGMSTYLITEALTNTERSRLYNEILRQGSLIKPRALIGIRVKFLFFVWLLIITILSFTALMEKGRFYNEYNFGIIALYFMLSVLASFFLMQITTRSIFNTLTDMRRVTKEIAEGGRAAFKTLSLEKEFAAIEFALMEMAWEIDDYRRSLESKVDQRTAELQEALESLKGRDEQIQKQLDMASVIQRSILPGKIDDWNELKFAVRYIAMEKIGGDFYDVYQLKDNKIGIIIADVSGHGIPAALVTTMAKISFSTAGSKFDSPKRIFQEVNQSILDHVKTQDYLTCFMLSIDDEYNVVYANASHQKAILLRSAAGEVELLDTNGLFIGAMEDAWDSYEEKDIRIEYGDRIILYTDGIPEAINDSRAEYSNQRLERVVFEHRHLPIEEFADAILNDVRSFIGTASVVDDITFLVIELARDEAVDIIKNAKKLINIHKYYEAIELLEKGLEKYPGNQKLLYNLSKNFFRVNNYGKSAQVMQKYLEHDKRNKFAFYVCGSAFYQLAEYTKAIAYFESALDIDQNFVNALFAQGMSFKKMGDTPNAEKCFERVVAIDPDNKMALFELKELRQAMQ